MKVQALHALLFALLVVACGDISATNPFDPRTPGDQQAHGLLRGRLVPPAGFDLAQVEEVHVDLRRVDAPDAGDALSQVKPSTDGAALGRFVFENVVPGQYRLVPVVPGFSVLTRTPNEPALLLVAPPA